MIEYKCACNGKACDGICKEKNLFRKRTIDLQICPAAYKEKTDSKFNLRGQNE